MIIRIVRMSFKNEKVDEFLSTFNLINQKIRSFKGCTNLSLHQDDEQKNVFFTISHWESKDDLEAYRQSLLFKETWSKVKLLFDEQPKAFTLKG